MCVCLCRILIAAEEAAAGSGGGQGEDVGQNSRFGFVAIYQAVDAAWPL